MAFGDINREDYGQLPNLSPNLYATRGERRAAERKEAAERRSKGYTKPSLRFSGDSSDESRKSTRPGLSGRDNQLAPLLEFLDPKETRPIGRSVTKRGGNIADELEAQVDEKKTETKTSPTTEYRSRREGLDTVYPDRKPAATVTSPNTGSMPTNWAQYEEFLNNKLGIKLSGFESNDLPGAAEGSASTPSVPSVSQSGASGEADITDQTRALEVDQAKNRGLPRGARQREMFLRQNPGYGRPEAPEIEKGSGLSARSRAFLDYEGNSMGALRAADASQNLMRVGDKFGVKGADGEVTEITREGADAIRSGERNNSELGQDFLKQYLVTPSKPADAQSNDSISPKPATVDPAGEANPNQAGVYSNQLQGDIGSMFVDKDREPLMRFPNIKY